MTSAEKFVARFKPQCFYHFTDTRNIPSIRDTGLLSWSELRERGIVPPAPGANQWSHDADQRVGFDRYVHLCLFGEHPMEWRARNDGRIHQSHFLRIDPSIVHTEGVLFTPDVANKAGVRSMSIDEALRAMDFEVVYDRTDWRDPAVRARLTLAKKYELLVPASIDLTLITGF